MKIKVWKTRPTSRDEDPKSRRSLYQEEIDLPPIVCICGSTKFKHAFEEANAMLTLAGHIVLTVGVFRHVVGRDSVYAPKLTDEALARLDELHLRKIDMADWVLILNVDKYIGDGCRREIEYATKAGKIVEYVEKPGDDSYGLFHQRVLDCAQSAERAISEKEMTR